MRLRDVCYSSHFTSKWQPDFKPRSAWFQGALLLPLFLTARNSSSKLFSDLWLKYRPTISDSLDFALPPPEKGFIHAVGCLVLRSFTWGVMFSWLMDLCRWIKERGYSIPKYFKHTGTGSRALYLFLWLPSSKGPVFPACLGILA